ncbi:phosphoribosylglycinamide formyltransferase [Zongyangia hominis]|uniref:Phosphoribosylglycinamide formyltransferase n=1 Tax=Zongyangia hominis TaxID=2763677 RepID=A0A926ECL9_9FIRM|nr:phosphoribosylglycinamide formyltransferase [Zongyangia hominis]MBC8569769.1 phosphoribosylglycinamide formyltransferase [Zongyangia hominis]
MQKVAVLVSGGGTNLQAILDAQSSGVITDGRVVLVVSSSPKAYALERAGRAGIETAVVARKDYPDSISYGRRIIQVLNAHQIDLVVLAGFLSILSKEVTDAYKDRIINIHPALIPAFCGEGYYGLRVHEAALDYGVKVTGATVHFVNEVADGGKIIAQKAVEVRGGDTPEILQRRVMEEAEWELLPKAVQMLCQKRELEQGKKGSL